MGSSVIKILVVLLIVVIALVYDEVIDLWEYFKGKINGMISKWKPYWTRIYRMMLNPSKREAIVWKDLKRLFQLMEWKHGVYENDKLIEISFSFNEDVHLVIVHYIDQGNFESTARVIDGFPEEIISDVFILATHFNNLLNYGMVTVNAESRHVNFTIKQDLLSPYLYPGELLFQIEKHIEIADVMLVKSFQRLVREQEAPAIIIADLLAKLEEGEV